MGTPRQSTCGLQAFNIIYHLFKLVNISPSSYYLLYIRLTHADGMPEEFKSGNGEINVETRIKLMERLKDVEIAIDTTKNTQVVSAPSERDADAIMDLLDEKARLEEKIARLTGSGE